ncbi:MAG: hypothetical protein K2J39_02135 [Ruminococcus sp.]|nr:hypothetical protein [Ruminococcus sp.]
MNRVSYFAGNVKTFCTMFFFEDTGMNYETYDNLSAVNIVSYRVMINGTGEFSGYIPNGLICNILN